MELHVSLIGRKDLNGEIYRQLRRAVIDGRLRPGDMLPPSRELARRLTVSRTTVTLAYDRLAGEGFVESRVGAGTFVSEFARMARQGGRKRTGRALRPRPIWNSISLPTAFDKKARFDFRAGVPDAALFPHKRWCQLTARQLPTEAFAAVPGDPAGHRGLREAIAQHIGVSRGIDTSADEVTVTGGTQQALDILARVLLAQGDRVAVEDPGYPPPHHLFRSLGARVIGIPVDDEGLVVRALPRGIRLVYVTPSHQFPLGVSMSLSRRIELLAWAERTDAVIVEDDYDSEFRLGGRPIEPLQTLDSSGRVIYVGSFSKTMLPTLRLGFLVTPPSVSEAVHKAKYLTDWQTPTLPQSVLASFIDEGGFARHLRRMRTVYAARHDLITRTLAREFADHLEIIPSVTGLHVTALARSLTTKQVNAVARKALEAGVAVFELSSFAFDRPAPPGILLGYGAIPTAHIEEGLRRLRNSLGQPGPSE